MRGIDGKTVVTRLASVGAVVGAVTLGSQIGAWATTACQVPNPNTVYCTDKDVTSTCAGATLESICTGRFDAFERNQFPDGGASSQSGTTKEEEADCFRRKYCTWEANNRQCVSSTTWGDWVKKDKTVTGTNQCPTNEG